MVSVCSHESLQVSPGPSSTARFGESSPSSAGNKAVSTVEMGETESSVQPLEAFLERIAVLSQRLVLGLVSIVPLGYPHHLAVLNLAHAQRQEGLLSWNRQFVMHLSALPIVLHCLHPPIHHQFCAWLCEDAGRYCLGERGRRIVRS